MLARIFHPYSIVGGLVALFLLMGRWTPFRPEGFGDDHVVVPLHYELRLYLVGLTVLFGLLFADRLPSPLRLRVSFVSLMAFLIFGIVSGFIESLPETISAYSSRKQVDFLLLVLILPIVWAYASAEQFEKELWRWIYAACLVLMAAGVYSLVAGVDDEQNRIAVLKGGPNVFGRLMGLLAIVAASHYFQKQRLIRGSAAASLIAALLVVASGSRGASLALAIAGLFAILMARKLSIKTLVYAAVGLGALVALIALSPFGLFDAIYERFVIVTFEEGYTSSRDVIAALALEAISKHFWFGAGIGGFSAYDPVQLYPHNLFLEVWTEFGVVGFFLAFVPLGFAVARKALRSAAVDRNTIAVVFLLVASMFSGDIYDARGVFVFALLIIRKPSLKAYSVSSSDRRLHSASAQNSRLF